MKTRKNFAAKAIGIAVFALAGVTPQLAFAQGRISVELRPGVNFATRNLGDADLKTGFGVEGIFAYQFLRHFGIYAGWGLNRFNARESFAGPDVNFEETGYSYGLQFMHAIGQSNVSLLGRAGVLSNHIEIEDNRGDVIGGSGHGFRDGIGWQIEGRVAWPLAERWLVIPSLRYRSLPRVIRIGAADTDVVLSYISLGMGIARTF
ncbi:MAG TPA: opacity protein [Chryseosolibacter sp.]